MAERHAYLDRGLRGWIVNTARAQHWRMASWYTKEDLVQDGYICYVKCWNHYRELFDVPNPTKAQQRHFMSLVQTSFLRHITTLSSKSSLGKEIPVSSFEFPNQREDAYQSLDSTFDKWMPLEHEQASLACTLAKLPTELAEALDRLIQDGFDGGKYLRKKLDKQTSRKLRETTDQYWTRVSGVSNFPEKLADHLLA